MVRLLLNRIRILISDKRRYIEDVLLNILATALPLVLLQFVILPGVNKNTGEDAYGLIVTIVSIFTYVSSTVAGTLNNIRLLMELKYKENDICGDFNILQTIFSVICAFFTVVVALFYAKEYSYIQFLELALVTIIICADGYYSVGFRLRLNFKLILFQKILLSIGYYIGFRLFLITKQWMLIYIVGYGMSLAFSIVKTDLITEPWVTTALLKETIRKETILIVSSLIGGLATYVDRLIIFPIYGGIITSTYYASTLLGKGISLATFPISGVLLSYFSGKKNLATDTLKYMTIFGWISGLIGYVFFLIVSRPILTLLYPNLIDEAIKYVPVNLFASVIGVQNTLLSPVVLKFCDTKWQIFISSISVLCYLTVSMIMLNLWGLMGFCVGGAIGALIKYIIYRLIYKRINDKK